MRAILWLCPILLAGCAGGVNFDYDALRGGMGAQDVRHLPPDQALECQVPTSGVGLSWCETEITQIDGLKAARVQYYFMDGKLESARVQYSPDAYEAVAKMMDARYKRYADPTPGQATWKVAGGAVISSAGELRDGNVATYWLSREAMRKEATLCSTTPGICD
jgi:hypothetical protein